MARNVLLVSIGFPPKNDPESIQTGKYFKYLRQNENYSYEVLTSKLPTLFMPYDPDLEHFIEGFDDIQFISVPETKLTNFALRKIKFPWIGQPDSKFFFHRHWRSGYKNLKRKPDIIYSRSNPVSSTLCALRLQETLNVPWVLHMSDPWSLSPLHQYNQRQLAYHREMEKVCLDKASVVCFTSAQTIDMYTEHYPQLKDKFVWMPNVYDETDVSQVKLSWDKLRLVYTGGLTSDRSAKYLISALEVIHQEDPDLLTPLEAIFAGDMDRPNREAFANTSLTCVKHVGRLPYKESLSLQKSAHALFLIDDPLDDPSQGVFLPSKLLDYMLAKRRVLSITNAKSTTEKFLKAVNSDIIRHKEHDELVSLIKKYLFEFAERNTTFFLNEFLPEDYAASYNADRLSTLFDQL